MLRFNRVLSLYGNGIAFDDRVAGSYGYLTGLVKEAGRNPRSRTADLRSLRQRTQQGPRS